MPTFIIGPMSLSPYSTGNYKARVNVYIGMTGIVQKPSFESLSHYQTIFKLLFYFASVLFEFTKYLNKFVIFTYLLLS